jgi:hypothetical protein
MEPFGQMDTREIVKVERPAPVSVLDPWLIFDPCDGHSSAAFGATTSPKCIGRRFTSNYF